MFVCVLSTRVDPGFEVGVCGVCVVCLCVCVLRVCVCVCGGGGGINIFQILLSLYISKTI